jgi:hypothetical protein
VLVIPAAETTNQVGSVTITAKSLSLESATNTATFSGGARAVSNGATKFDISAQSFTLVRDAKSGGLNTLRSSGRALLKVNLPQTATTTARSANFLAAVPVRLEARPILKLRQMPSQLTARAAARNLAP